MALSAYKDSQRIEAALSGVVAEPLAQDIPPAARTADRDAIEQATRVNDNYARGMSYRAPWIDDRSTAYDYKEHRQWPTTGIRSKKKVQITVNKIMPAINRIMAFISKTKMTVAIEGVGPEDSIKGKIFNLIFERSVRDDQTEFKFHECLKDSRISGLGVGKEIWNWERNFPFGQPELQFLKSDEIIIEPGAMGMQFEDADWIIHHQRVTVEKLKALYPEYDDQIKPDTDWLREAERPHWFSAYPAYDRQGINSAGGSILSDISRQPEMTTIKEMWYKDFQRVTKRFALRQINALMPPQTLTIKAGEEIPDNVVQGLELQAEQDFVEIPFVITKIRVSTVINNILVHDRPSPYAHDRYPFVFFKANPLDKFTYPAGDVIFGVELQDVINKLHSINVDQMVRSNWSPLTTERGALDPKTVETLAKYGMSNSQFLELRRGAKLQRTPPPVGIQDGFLLLLRELSSSFDELMGYHDIDRADAPAGTSGKGMEQLQLSSDVFHSPKNNPIQQALLWWAKELRMPNVQTLMKQQEMIRVDDRLAKQIGATPHAAFLASSPQSSGGHYTINQPGLSEPGPDGQMQPITLNALDVGRYDLKVNLAADYAETRRSQTEAAIGLKRIDVYDAKAVLEAIDDPHAEEIMARVDEKNSLLQIGKQVAENPVLMAVLKDPNIQQAVEAMLKAAPQGAAQPPAPAQGVPQ